MMKFFIIAVSFAFCTSTAFAQTSGSANANANIGVGATIGSQAIGDQSITFNSASQAPVVGSSLPGFSSAQIFTKPDVPAQARGIPLTMGAKQVCGVRWTREYRGVSEEARGNSGKTTILWSGFPDYQRIARGSLIELAEVTPPLFEKEPIRSVRCLGIVTITTRAGSEKKTDFGTIENDLADFLFSSLRGVSKVKLFTVPDAIGFPTGVSTGGTSFGLGGILGHLVSAASSGVVNPSFTTGSGTATPVAWIGATFLILAEDQTDGITINPADLVRYYGGQAYGNGTPPSPAAVQSAPRQ